jgi:hypothetical protein
METFIRSFNAVCFAFWLTIVLLMTPATQSVQAADGGGHGAAYGCVQKGSKLSGSQDFPYQVTLTNTCAKAVAVYWCAKNPNASPPGWRCLSDSRPANGGFVGFDTLGVVCRDASCGDWAVEWNAVYADSGETLAIPEEKDKRVISGR